MTEYMAEMMGRVVDGETYRDWVLKKASKIRRSDFDFSARPPSEWQRSHPRHPLSGYRIEYRPYLDYPLDDQEPITRANGFRMWWRHARSYVGTDFQSAGDTLASLTDDGVIWDGHEWDIPTDPGIWTESRWRLAMAFVLDTYREGHRLALIENPNRPQRLSLNIQVYLGHGYLTIRGKDHPLDGGDDIKRDTLERELYRIVKKLVSPYIVAHGLAVFIADEAMSGEWPHTGVQTGPETSTTA